MKNFERFGVMIDCSRNAVPSIDGLKKFFTILAKMGYDCVMLYTEDTYEVEDEPYFGYKRGRYSIAEMQEIDRFAASIGIEVIPCIQTLAHLNAIFRWDEYRKIKDIDDILLLDDERTMTLIERMFATLSKSFASRKIHIGMDEAHNVGLGKYLDRHGFGDRYELILRHLNKVCEIARKYGYEPMMWEDMFFRLANHGDYYVKEPLAFSDDVVNKVPSDCSMVYWDYYSTDEAIYDAMITSSKRLSDKVWFAGGAWVWGGFAPHNRYSFRRNQIAIPKCIEHGIKNVILTMWGDNGGECAYFSGLAALMHAAALAEGLTEEEMKAKFHEITGENYDAFVELDLPNYVYGEERSVGTANYSKNRLYDDPFLAIMSVNTEEATPEVLADYAKRLRERAKESPNFSYLFETAAALCHVMALKFNLPARTRYRYAKKNKDALMELAEKDYPACISRLTAFYTAYRKQWYAVNKTYGFEIQDARLGGLMQRMRSCRERIIAYCHGEIDRIEELEEGLLPMNDGNVGAYVNMFSANIM